MDGIAAITSRIAEIRGTLAAFDPPVVASSMTTTTASGARSTSGTFATALASEVSRTAGAAASGRHADGAAFPTELAAYGNGRIPREALSEVGSTGHRMWSPAARQYEALSAAAARDGVTIGITDSYRTYESQVILPSARACTRTAASPPSRGRPTTAGAQPRPAARRQRAGVDARARRAVRLPRGRAARVVALDVLPAGHLTTRRGDPASRRHARTAPGPSGRGRAARCYVAPSGPAGSRGAARGCAGRGGHVTVLVTGGAGYIGAHIVRSLRDAGTAVVVVDDLSTGRAARIAGVPLLRADLADVATVPAVVAFMARHGVDAVVHMAGVKRVDESIADPARYYRQNVGQTAHVLTAMEAAGVRDLVFSSSAAVYGETTAEPVRETDPTRPLNPYGATKLAAEDLLRWAAATGRVDVTALRYFNVAGAGGPTSPTARGRACCRPSSTTSRPAGRRPSSATTTRRRTARACGTTCTSRTSPMRTCWPSVRPGRPASRCSTSAPAPARRSSAWWTRCGRRPASASSRSTVRAARRPGGGHRLGRRVHPPDRVGRPAHDRRHGPLEPARGAAGRRRGGHDRLTRPAAAWRAGRAAPSTAHPGRRATSRWCGCSRCRSSRCAVVRARARAASPPSRRAARSRTRTPR